jgi:hypothetical protein
MNKKSLFVFDLGWLNYIKHSPAAKDMWDLIGNPELDEFLVFMNHFLSNTLDPNFIDKTIDK